jgi:hypothetical protein
MQGHKHTSARDLFGLLFLLGEAVVAIGCTGAAALLSAFPVDDAVAPTLTTWDWWRTGLARFGTFALLGLLGGICLFVMNHYASRLLFVKQDRLPWKSAIAFGGAIILSSFIGTVFFVLGRPWF